MGATKQLIESSNYQMPPIEARDWGRKEYQEELLGYIEKAISELADEDTAGHVYWNKFKEVVMSLKP